MHHHRSEHWIVVSGTAKVTCGEKESIVNVNESTFIPMGNLHRLENPGIIPLIIIEVQSGEYLGEDDIVRFHDDYHRAEGNTTTEQLRQDSQAKDPQRFADNQGTEHHPGGRPESG